MWNWTVLVTAAEHTCMLAVISADEDPATRSDANPNDHLLWFIVPNDKHIALRIYMSLPGLRGLPMAIASFIDFHNPLKFPQRFDIVFDLSTLPKETKLSVLLPKAQMWTPITQKLANGIRIGTVTGQEWRWSKVRSISRRGWHYDCRVEGSLEPCTGRRLAHIPGIVIAAAEKLMVAHAERGDRIRIISARRLTPTERRAYEETPK